MGPIYRFLGLTVGFVQESMPLSERQAAYSCDVTYLTAKESGFDYLRDSLSYDPQHIVHRPFHFAIVDEADSILIDEARVPLVIAGSVDEKIADSYLVADIARRMEAGVDFDHDEYARNVHLTDRGQRMAERLLKCGNLYASKNLDTITRLFNALHAEYLLARDVDYIVRDGKIELVDEFTGRVADKRRWPDGLQAAVEAKEHIDIQNKGNILNQITLQHFLKLYPKLCGMTATAASSEDEFKTFYNLEIAIIPPNVPCIRKDLADIIFQSKAEKHAAIMKEILSLAKTGRPILVGTSSVDESSRLAEALVSRGLECHVLNAKHNDREAEIIAEAGKLGAVTISTNMAGRGTDIKLGGSDEAEKQRVFNLGGLYVIGTNKHETERIDRQLRGRAGRQGDPGSSRYFVSLQDDLMIKYRLDELLPPQLLNIKADGEIDNSAVRKEVARIQRICDGQNLEIKKTLNQYSHLLEKQRTVLFQRRQDVLYEEAAVTFFQQESPRHFKKLASVLDYTQLCHICRSILLYKIDSTWSTFLAQVADVREGIHLKRLGGREPYIEFQKISIELFDEHLENMDVELIKLFDSLNVSSEINLEELGIKAPGATWTYLINDNTFENQLGIALIGNAGLQIGAGILGPLLALQLLFQKKSDKTKPAD
jgi:preprotein translocase subunit SecA